MNNAFLLVPSWDCPINVEHTTERIKLPSGSAIARFSLVAAQPMRDRPQFGFRLQMVWTNQLGQNPVVRENLVSFPKAEWSQQEIDDGLPVSAHAVGSPPGIVPHDVGSFAYQVEGAPAINFVEIHKLPAEYDHAFLRYTILGGNNGSPVNVAVVVEGLTENWEPLEFA